MLSNEELERRIGLVQAQIDALPSVQQPNSQFRLLSDVHFGTLVSGHVPIWSETEHAFINGPASGVSQVSITGGSGSQTPMGMGDSAQSVAWDTVYIDDPVNVTTDTELPAGMGLIVGGGSLPTTFFEATETGVWLVAASVYVTNSATEVVSLGIFGDFSSPVSPVFPPLQSGGIVLSGNQAVGFTWVPSLSAGDSLFVNLVRDDDTNAYDGVTDSKMRIVRIA